MRELHFKQIRSGRKTQTRRLHKFPFIAGQKAVLNRNYYEAWSPLTRVLVLESYPQLLGETTEKDALKEGFNDLQDFKANWKKYTGCGF